MKSIVAVNAVVFEKGMWCDGFVADSFQNLLMDRDRVVGDAERVGKGWELILQEPLADGVGETRPSG